MVRFLTVLCLLLAITLAGVLIMERLKLSIVIAPADHSATNAPALGR